MWCVCKDTLAPGCRNANGSWFATATNQSQHKMTDHMVRCHSHFSWYNIWHRGNVKMINFRTFAATKIRPSSIIENEKVENINFLRLVIWLSIIKRQSCHSTTNSNDRLRNRRVIHPPSFLELLFFLDPYLCKFAIIVWTTALIQWYK